MKLKLPLSFCFAFIATFLSVSNAQYWSRYHTGNSPIISDQVTSLAVSDSGFVWAATMAGLSYFNGNSWKTENFSPIGEQALTTVITRGDNVYVGSATRGVLGRFKTGWKDFDHPSSGVRVVGIGVDSRDSLYRLDSYGGFMRAMNNYWQIISSQNLPANLFVDRSDNLWLLYLEAGMQKYKNGSIVSYRNELGAGNPNYIPAKGVFDMVQDKQGILWLATDNGLVRFDGTQFQVYNKSNSAIHSNSPRSIAIDSSGKIWLGSRDAGLASWDGNAWKVYNTSNSPMPSLIINDIAIDKLNRIWVANGYNSQIVVPGGNGIFVFDQFLDPSNGQKPVSPDSLRAKAISTSEVRLTWKDNSSSETGYVIERAENSPTAFSFLRSLPQDARSYEDQAVSSGKTYYYRVSAFNANGSSAYSDTANAQPKYCGWSLGPGVTYTRIQKVSFGSISNRYNDCTRGYHEFLDQTTEIYSGKTMVLNLSLDRCNKTTDPVIGATAYIDWNSNGDFNDPGEVVFNNIKINGRGNFYVPVTVPSGVVPGTVTRLRVVSGTVNNPAQSIAPCGAAEMTHDYSLVITNGPTTQVPADFHARRVSARVAQLEWIDNSNSEQNYIIERSADGVTYTTLTTLSANQSLYSDSTVSPGSNYFYRVVAKTASAQFTSSVLAVTTASADLAVDKNNDLDLVPGITGMYWTDVNQDGKPDLYLVGGSKLLTNQATGLKNSGQSFDFSWTASFTDIDNDGDDDLFLGYSDNPNTALSFYENDGKGGFTKMPFSIPPQGVLGNFIWTDYNKDGFPDLYLAFANNEIGKLYRNNGNKTFTLARTFTDVSGVASFTDIDNDGDQDLVHIGGAKPGVYKIQDTVFVPEKNTGLELVQNYTNGLSWADYDNDGDPDLFVANSPFSVNADFTSTLFINDDTGKFSATKTFSGAMIGETVGSSWADYDNDGWQDLYVSRFKSGSTLYGNKKGTLTALSVDLFTGEDEARFPEPEGLSNGVAWGDYNSDGFPDLCTDQPMTGGVARLYRNGTNQNKWINIYLKGTVSNSNAIGAKIMIKTNNGWQHRWISSSSDLRSSGTRNAAFGLGTASIIDSIIVNWPSGIRQTLNNVNVNQFMVITEKSVPTAVSDLVLTPTITYPNPASNLVYLEPSTNLPLRSKLVSVIDGSGRTHALRLNKVGTRRYAIDVSGLSAGGYLLMITEKDVIIRQKIIVGRK